ncbi:MAG: beta-galactosidase [Lentisphaeria bacterium]|nr:beta-galactosidase [Lentisphaeria bacterium]
MKKIWLCMFAAAFGLTAADLSLFPEKMIQPMVGFDKWQCGKDAITAEQTKPYSWTAPVPVKMDAAAFRYFNVELAADAPIDGKLTMYFRNEGEKKFDAKKFFRTKFTLEKDVSRVVSLPLNGALWQGNISCFRFDLSGRKGIRWTIRRVWFSDSRPADANGDFVVFPGAAPIYGMVGFKSLTREGETLAAEQSKAYAWTADIQLGIKAEDYHYFNCLIETPDGKPAQGSLSIYFKNEGEKKFSSAKFLRTSFSVNSPSGKVVSIPLKKNWTGFISAFRFDLSSNVGQKWIIRKIWFSSKQPTVFMNRAFYGTVALTPEPKTFTETRLDLVNNREYRFAFEAVKAKTDCEVRFFSADDRPLGTVRAAHKNELTFTVPDNAVRSEIKLTASSPDGGSLSRFTLQENAGSAGPYWQAAWICHPEAKSTKGLATFSYRREFELAEMPADARIQLTADDGYVLIVNGKEIARRRGAWQQTALHEVVRQLKQGKNVLEIRVFNENGPTGLIAELLCEFPDGKKQLVKTDRDFRVVKIRGTRQKNVDFSDAVPAFEIGVPPIAPWHRVAYHELKPRPVFQPAANTLRYDAGRITGSLELTDKRISELPMLLIWGDSVCCDFRVPVAEGRAEISLDLSSYGLIPGKYELTADPRTFTGKTELLSLTVPERGPEHVPRFAMKNTRGFPQATADGKPFWFGGFKSSRESQKERAYREADYRVMFFGASMGGAHGSNSGRVWVGPERYDYAAIDASLEKYVRKYPKAKLIVTYGIDAPAWWCKAHPEDCVWFENGTGPEGLTSMASVQWRKESTAALREFLRHMKKSPYSAHILGYRIQAHLDGGEFQYLGTWQRKFADYSPAMQAYFRKFLKERYGSDAALQKAWNKPSVTLETAAIPTGKERSAAGLMVFQNLEKNRNVADFIDCLSDAMVTGAMEHLQVIREEAPDKLAGLYGGYVFYYSGFQLLNSGHVGFGKLYRSRLADFICSPNDYIQRQVGWPAGHHGDSVGSSLYNLSYWDENDTRTCLCAASSHRNVDNLHETIGVLKRDHILQVTKGLGNTFYDLAGGWFDNSGIMDAMRTMNRIGEFAQTLDGFERSRAAVLYSAESIKYLSLKNDPVTVPVRRDMRRNLGWSGVPVDQYLLEDIRQDNFPDYDCFILPNVYAPDAELRKLIREKLDKPGKLLVFGYAPGAFRAPSGKIDPEAMKELTGIKFGYELTAETRQVRTASGEFGSGVKFGPAFFIDDPAAEKLGTFTASGRTAIAKGKAPGGADVVVALTPEMTPELWREIFRGHGLHIFCESGDPVYYDGRFMAVHANTDGRKTIRLPEKREWFDLFRRKKVSGPSETLEMDMRRGQTEVFFIGSEADFRRYLQMK